MISCLGSPLSVNHWIGLHSTRKWSLEHQFLKYNVKNPVDFTPSRRRKESISCFFLSHQPPFLSRNQIPKCGNLSTRPLSMMGDQRNIVAFAGRSKKKAGGPSSGRIEGNAEVRREAKKNARKRSRRIAENYFFRKNDPDKNYADEFTEEELEMIGLGYDRQVRFMDQNNPMLHNPHDWYKYGEFGPYSWRGVVVGDPVRGRFSDERVSMISSVKDQEEWEQIEQFDMVNDYGQRIGQLDEAIGLKYFWVFVRHPRWKHSELPWEQWTLVSEVAIETTENRLNKWNLMGRLGNKTRSLITQCAAWMRPDILYVKRPVYQCRFEPQDELFQLCGPLLDPQTEGNYMFEVQFEDGKREMCTYFGGLCKIVRVNPKSYVDDVVKAYEKLNNERKSLCWEFLLSNHPVPLLHPYTREWKAKLEEMEFGCDAQDEGDEQMDKMSFTDWIEDEEGDVHEDDDVEDDEDDNVIDIGSKDESDKNDELGIKPEPVSVEDTEKYWEDEFEKAIRDSKAMEDLVEKTMKKNTEIYKRQMEWMNDRPKSMPKKVIEREIVPERKREGQQSSAEWEDVGYGRMAVKKSRIPPELFSRAAVRPFTYKNLLKEIVLMRHAIIDQEVTLRH